MAETPLDVDRIFMVAEAVLEAVEVYRLAERPSPWPPELLWLDPRPECLRNITRAEVEDATRFLLRLGILVVVKENP